MPPGLVTRLRLLREAERNRGGGEEQAESGLPDGKRDAEHAGEGEAGTALQAPPAGVLRQAAGGPVGPQGPAAPPCFGPSTPALRASAQGPAALRRIRLPSAAPAEPRSGSAASPRAVAASPAFPPPDFPGWEEAGHLSLKRRTAGGATFLLPRAFPAALAILAPDAGRYLDDPRAAGALLPEDLLFFDLETTGLSTAAGTVAFLAAFGRFTRAAPPGTGESAPAGGAESAFRLETAQYLLLDFPGEPDFLEAALSEFSPVPGEGARPPLLVTYNGKTFDIPIIRNRALMAGIWPPEVPHADLLHPARRLWKRVLPSCSQRVVEEEALGLDRAGDTGGDEAPDIWFDFLKTGKTERLRAICDHNLRDIAGLASLFACFAEIAAAPVDGAETYRCDTGRLALAWRKALVNDGRRADGGRFGAAEREWGAVLLERAALAGWPEAASLAAIHAEWREKDPARALVYVERALAREALPQTARESLLCRRERLLRKAPGH